MATVIEAGQTVVSNITVQNVGQQTGTFDVFGTIFNKAGQDVGSFTATPVTPEATTPDDTVERVVVGAGQSQVIQMFKVNWALGDPTNFESQQLFDVEIDVNVIETGQGFSFTFTDALQHQTLQAAQPQVQAEFTIEAAA